MLAEMRVDRQRAEVERQRAESGVDDRRHYRRHDRSTVVFVVPQYRYFPYALPGTTYYGVTPPPPTPVVTPIAAPPAPEPPAEPMGILHLDVEPEESLQIFVDGAFIGTPADLGDEIGLAPGTRRVEFRARGYKPQAINVEIVEDRTITYRGALERVETAPAALPAPAVVRPAAPGSRTMYMIPGCYLGNVSPKDINLRPGCDISKLTTITP